MLEDVWTDRQATVAFTVGGVLAVIGIAGFVSGGDELLIFGVNAVHNAYHLVVGGIGVGAAVRGGRVAQQYNIWVGVLFLVLAILGLFEVSAVVDLLNVNAADNWLHIVLGLVLVGTGLLRR